MSEAKGYDDSPPRNGAIFFYAVLTVVVLIGVKFLLDSYFMSTMEGEVYEKVLSVGMEQVAEKRAKDQATLESSGLGAAMQVLAQRGRAASPKIAPKSGQGQPEVAGWSQLGREVAPAKTSEAEAATEEPSADAGHAQPEAAEEGVAH